MCCEHPSSARIGRFAPAALMVEAMDQDPCPSEEPPVAPSIDDAGSVRHDGGGIVRAGVVKNGRRKMLLPLILSNVQRGSAAASQAPTKVPPTSHSLRKVTTIMRRPIIVPTSTCAASTT